MRDNHYRRRETTRQFIQTGNENRRRARWLAVFVQTPACATLEPSQVKRIKALLKLVPDVPGYVPFDLEDREWIDRLIARHPSFTI